MTIIDKLSKRLERHPKRVVFPEGSDPRVLQAARQFATKKLGAPILIGERTKIKDNAAALNIRLDGIRIIEPSRSDELELFLKKFQGLRRFKGLDDKESRDYVLNNNYFAAMMLTSGNADALVGGATIKASSALRPLFQIVSLQPEVTTASSMMLLETPEKKYGVEGTLFLSDCGVIPDPDENQLADIALTTARLAFHLTDVRPKVAMISYTTKSPRANLPITSKVKAATALAKAKFDASNFDGDIDGEMQVDAALIKEVARQKGLDGSVSGNANVLIFPDLASGNNAVKMMQILGGARAYGQIITGLKKPAAEISRSASAHDIYGTAVVVAAQAVDKKFLYAVELSELNKGNP